MNKVEDTEEYKNDFRKVAIYLSVYLLEKKDFFFQMSILRLKDYVVKTRWREPSVNMHVFKEKKKEKERKKYRKLNYPYLHSSRIFFRVRLSLDYSQLPQMDSSNFPFPMHGVGC